MTRPPPLGPDFRALWGSSAASNLSDGLAFVSMPLLAASLTDDPRLVAGLATTYAAVRLVVALPVGVYVDRLDRRFLLVGANLLRGAAVVGLAVAVQLDVASLWVLYGVMAVVGVLESAADNAAISILPSIVPLTRLDRANGRIAAAQLVADEFAGPPLGGLLFSIAAAVPVYAMGGLWASAGLVALALPVRTVATAGDRSARRPVVAEARDGVVWLAHDRTVGGLALVGALASVGYMLAFSILVLVATDRLGLDGLGYGLLLAFSALGGLLGAVVTARLRARIGYRWTIVASLLTGAASLGVLAVTTDAVVAAVALAVYVLHAVVWSICATSLRQRLVPDPVRGRVNAASKVASLLGLTVGSALGGVLASVDLALPVAVGSAVFLACALVAAARVQPDHTKPDSYTGTSPDS